ncbi:hypothetical protein STEG23_035956 [Scotinomys teguina]
MAHQRHRKQNVTAVGEKRVPRTGWLYRNLENPESVSDLIYHMAIMVMVTRHDHLNKNWENKSKKASPAFAGKYTPAKSKP